MTRGELARRIARQFRGRFLRGYVRSKVRTDPVYAAAVRALRGDERPLFDIGCGIGLLAFYLRECGFTGPITGVDHDAAKVRAANDVAPRYGGLSFTVGDARALLPARVNVAALDVLHYFRDDEQRRILASIADAIAPGGVAIIRECVRDGSLRYRITAAQEAFSRLTRWLKAERVNFATRDQITAPFRARGFEVTAEPMWGRTPFNNYLFVFRRPGEGMTNE